VVAAIHGYALGGGLENALCCTWRIAVPSAKVGLPEVLIGIIPGGGGTQRLPRVVGASRAKEIMVTGRQVRADEAFRIGLADEVVTPEQLHERALALAAEVARGAVLAQAMVKRAVDEGIEGALADGLRLERQLFTDVFNTSDSQVGVASFLEHGPGKATFSGS
jgi:enoyl-CoA hydratase